MSYDLFFRPRTGRISGDEFERYFTGRPNYKVDFPQAWYQNEETGVYFVFQITDDVSEGNDERFDVSLNINYFRPSYFILEAEPEVSEFVQRFDLVVSDPQVGGMGDGEYKPELLLNGWSKGNEFGYSAIIKQHEDRAAITHLPSAVLMKVWRWNHGRLALQRQLGETKFVPQIMFLVVDGKPSTAATWPDGIPIAVPDVDYFIVPRKELAPTKFFRRVEDHTVVPASSVREVFQRHSHAAGSSQVLNYVQPPRDVADFVRALPKTKFIVKGVAADGMLDSELVASAAA
jgi:hypothetical protein